METEKEVRMTFMFPAWRWLDVVPPFTRRTLKRDTGLRGKDELSFVRAKVRSLEDIWRTMSGQQ